MGRDPKAEVEISAHSRGLGAKLKEARAKFANFGSDLKKHVFGKELVEKGFWSKAGAHMVGNLGANIAGKAGDLLVDQARDVYAFEKTLTRLGIAAGKTPEEMRKFANDVRATSGTVGLSANNILGAARAYVALTGDMDGAAAATKTWARVAQATDSNVEDVARTAAALKQNLKIDPSDMEAAFSALATQGKEGAIELKDLSGQLANIAPQWAMFKGGSGLQGLKEMGAALQVVKQGFGGDASETVTGMQSLLTSMIKNAKNFHKAGVEIFEKDPVTGAKRMRNVLEVVRAISDSKLVKDPTKLEKAFGRVEAYRAFIQLSQNKELLDQLIAKSGDTQVISRDLDKYLASPAGRIEAAWEHAKNKIAEAFTPERIDAFASSLEHAAASFGPIISGLSKIAEFFPNAFKTGQQMRDYFSGENTITPFDSLRAAAGDDEAQLKVANVMGRADYVAIQAADSPLARKHLGIKANSSADLAFEYANAQGPGAAAKRAAAQKWYRGQGPDRWDMTPKDQPGVVSPPMTEATLQKLLDEMRKQTAILLKGTNVEVGGDAVVKAQRGAAQHARNPRG